MPLEVKDLDRQLYRRHLAGFLPHQIIDFHTHVWLRSFETQAPDDGRSAAWARWVAAENPIEDLLDAYRRLCPRQTVTPLIFGYPSRDVDLDRTNAYVGETSRQHHLPGLIVTTPEWSAQELERRAVEGGFLGLKPYLAFAPLHLAADEVTILDFLPPHHLEVADAHGWIVMLHIPRSGRLKDPVNLDQMLAIERRYPRLRLVVAHIGRAYCEEDVGRAFEVLRDAGRIYFDFSANTNAAVMEGALRALGPQRILFGSDLPILRMRMRRICENGFYVNLVPPGLYGDISGDPHMREVSQAEGDGLSFFFYEELLAFRRAAEATALSAADLRAVFYDNAARLIAGAGGTLGDPVAVAG